MNEIENTAAMEEIKAAEGIESSVPDADAAVAQAEEIAAGAGKEPAENKQNKLKTVLIRTAVTVLTTLVLLVAAVYGAGFILVKGPSQQMSNLFVMTMRETSAMKWVANLYLSAEEIEAMETAGEDEAIAEMDATLVQIGEGADSYGLVDEDGDGIILETVKGSGYVGYMMIVLDPSRMMMGTPLRFGYAGLTVEKMVETYDCVAGVNGGGFEDPNGTGKGGIPKGMIVLNGETDYCIEGRSYEFVGFDDQYVLHTGKMTPEEARAKNIQFGCSFGPVLLVNGEETSIEIFSGVNPRTAIGQRADGAVLLLVVDGRQAYSLGATYEDLAQIMLDYGAVNACNLDGGSSTVMWYNDGYVNQCMTFVGIRPIPTGFLVKKLEG